MSKQKLGVWTSTSLVVGNMIGSGIFLLPASLGALGSISLFGWLLSAMGAMALSFVFIELSKIFPGTSGGPYTYTRSGLGNFAGFLVAWGYWISVWCTNAAIAVAFVSYLSVFIPVLATNFFLSLIVGLSTIWILVWINTEGIRKAGIFQLITTILKIIPLVIIGIGGLFFIKIENFFPVNISGLSDINAILTATTLTFFAFMGVECATIPAKDVEDPQVTIPKATKYGLLFTMTIYILSSISIIGILPVEVLQNSNAPFADAAALIWGEWAQNLVAFGAMVSTLGALNGWILVQGQIPAAIARDKLFPSFFGRLNKKGAPAPSLILSSILLSILILMNYTKGLVKAFEFIILLASMTALIAYLFSSAAYVVVAVRQKGWHKELWKPTIFATIAFIFSLWAIAGSGQQIVYLGFLLLMAGIPVYVWMIAKKDVLE